MASAPRAHEFHNRTPFINVPLIIIIIIFALTVPSLMLGIGGACGLGRGRSNKLF
jgi:hypothetical protein